MALPLVTSSRVPPSRPTMPTFDPSMTKQPAGSGETSLGELTGTEASRLSERFGERLGDREREPEGGADRQSLILHPLPEAVSLEELEHDIGISTVLARCVDGDDVRVIESGSYLRLEEEPLDEFLVTEPSGPDDLDRHLSPELGVRSEVDLSHTVATDEPNDFEVIDDLRLLQDSWWRVAFVPVHCRVCPT